MSFDQGSSSSLFTFHLVDNSWVIPYLILRGKQQVQLQSGRTQSERPYSLHHACMPEQMRVTAIICKHILCDEQSASCSGIDA